MESLPVGCPSSSQRAYARFCIHSSRVSAIADLQSQHAVVRTRYY
jgi:hypothetical protein